MYNNERKERYIEIRETNATLPPGGLRRLFNSTEPFEEKYGKDVCEWTVREIIDFYKYIDAYSHSSLVVKNSDLGIYTNWCLTETLVPDGQNHFLEIDMDMLSQCVNKVYLESLIIARDELLSAIDRLPNYGDRFMYLAFFEGICGPRYQEMTCARYDDIEGDVIKLCTGREVTITSKLKEIAWEASTENQWQSYKEGGRLCKFSDLEPSDLIFKTTRRRSPFPPGASIQVVQQRYKSTKDFMGLPQRLTIKNLLLSGKIHYIKQLMVEQKTGVEDVVTKNKDVINARYTNDKIMTTVDFVRRYGTYFQDT